jgi:DNA-binding FadR family transcriptional regulator
MSRELDQEEDRYRPGYEIVAEQLLVYIAQQDLRPGDRLPTEKGLAEVVGATRNVTREAIKVLAAIGRVSVRKGAGIFVAAAHSSADEQQLVHYQPTDMAHVLMLLDYRRLIEADTARRAASLATPIEVRAIREQALRSSTAAEAADAAEFAEADAAFHDAVSLAAHNVFLQAGVTNARRFAGQSDVLLFHGDVPGSLKNAAGQHVAIAEAIAAGDPDLAASLMTQHVDTTRQQFETKIRDRLFTLPDRKSLPDPTSTPAREASA